MNDMSAFERRFEDRVRAFARAGVRPVDSAAVARAVAAGHPRSVRSGSAVRWLGFDLDRRVWAVVLALGMLITLLGGALLVGTGRAPSTLVDTPSLVLPNKSQLGVAGPSATPTLRPTPTVRPLLWSQASLDQDWPAPVRSEPVGGTIVRTRVRDGSRYRDPVGDVGSVPWIDIRELGVLGDGYVGNLEIWLVDTPTLVDPAERWMAYGVVVDIDRDGVPDWRWGVDNMPVDATGERPHRAWITDLHTGRTVSAPGAPYGNVGETYFDSSYPGTSPSSGPRFGFGGDTTGPPEVDALSGLRSPFYAWASVIQDGRVVATDYAPDVGWLDPSKAK